MTASSSLLLMIAAGYLRWADAAPVSLIAGVLTVLWVTTAVLWLAAKTGRLNAYCQRAVKWGSVAAGTVYAAEIALEYLLQPLDNHLWGWLEYGAVITIMLAVGFLVAREVRSAAAPVLACVSVSLWAYQGFANALLFAYLALSGSAAQHAVFAAEGEPQDFLDSGATDFETFIYEDYMGAVTYHAILSVAGGMLVGLICVATWRASTAAGNCLRRRR